MPSFIFKEKVIKHIHFIGISGISMCGLAKYLIQKYTSINVTGSTNLAGYQIPNIPINKDITTFIHAIDLCVISSSIKDNNDELALIKLNNILILHRSELIDIISQEKNRTLIIGSHGKSSTTTYIHQLLEPLNPTTFLGATLTNGESYWRGEDLYVIEGDESDKSFLNIISPYTVITNLDDDHLENYNDSWQEYLNTFKTYLQKVKSINKCIVYNKTTNKEINSKEKVLHHMIKDSQLDNISYGTFDSDINISVICSEPHLEWKISTHLPTFSSLKDRVFKVEAIIGEWNIYNITAAMIISVLQGLKIEHLNLYKPQRRMEIIYQAQETIIIDDYAVHPKEIQVVLRACINKYGRENLYIIWQPHRLTRLERLYEDFQRVFNSINRDHLFYTCIYEVDSIHSENVKLDTYIKYGTFVKIECIKELLNRLKGKTILLLNAGNLSRIVKEILCLI